MKKFLSIFKKKNIAGKTKVDPGHVRYSSLVGNDAFTDWTLVMTATCIIAFVMIGIGSYVYVDTQATLASAGNTSNATSSAARFDVKKLKQVINTFDVRAGERVLLGKGYNGPRDPSLP